MGDPEMNPYEAIPLPAPLMRLCSSLGANIAVHTGGINTESPLLKAAVCSACVPATIASAGHVRQLLRHQYVWHGL
jgi:hypothetical protein